MENFQTPACCCPGLCALSTFEGLVQQFGGSALIVLGNKQICLDVHETNATNS